MKGKFVATMHGEDVQNGYSIVCIIDAFDDLDKVRANIARVYGIEFDIDYHSIYPESYRSYRIINSDKDITLTIEYVNVM